ncbi:hypothetical protein [Saccharibacillus deserti]|uniref:hypothetical protein n=1 Tax=Saccharibacillus deserti TaxID=1634444 RepID=UPI00155658FF|nr:hypothetical protein [Saccharibacillus deserti]
MELQADVRWSLPSTAFVPFDIFEGDLGWNLSKLEFSLFFDADGEETEQRRYLAFHTAGNGDLLLFDLARGWSLMPRFQSAAGTNFSPPSGRRRRT